MDKRFLSAIVLSALLITAAKNTYAKEVTVPLNAGFGPSLNHFSGPVGKDQVFHYAINLEMCAVLDKQFINENINKVPRKYRKYAKKQGEARMGKWYIPHTVYISPQRNNTGIYGADWNPIGLAYPLIFTEHFKLTFPLGVHLTYLYIKSDSIFGDPGRMHFFRPGLGIGSNLELKFGENFLISLGGNFISYIPQEVKDHSSFFSIGDKGERLWYNGQLYFLFNFRFGYDTNI